jgi:hypothetical protein
MAGPYFIKNRQRGIPLKMGKIAGSGNEEISKTA